MADLLADLDRHTEALLASIAGLTDVDLPQPSLCTGWTRGHVLAHLARNADGLCALVRAAVDGTGETMYASNDRRDADIEAGARRPVAEQHEDVARTAAALAAALRRIGPEHQDARVERTPGGMRVRIGNLPAMRLREVVYHHIDLRAGFGFDDLDDAVLDRFLAVEVGMRQSDDPPPDLLLRTDDGAEWILGEGRPGRITVRGNRSGLLAWLARDLDEGVRIDR